MGEIRRLDEMRPADVKLDELVDTAVELGICATVMRDPTLLPKVMTQIDPEQDFTAGAYAAIWRAMLQLRENRERINRTTVANVVAPEWQRAVFQVATSLMIAPDIRDFADRLTLLRRRRAMFALGHELQVRAVAGEDPEGLAQLASDTGRQTLQESGDRATFLHDILDEIAAKVEQPAEFYPTHLKCLDEALGGGLFAGKLYGVGARMKAGKSALLATASFNLNMAGTRHLLLTLEMGRQESQQRTVARELGVDSLLVMLGTRAKHPIAGDRIRALKEVMPNETLIEHKPGATLDEVRRMIASAAMNHGCKGAVVDYLQLVGGRDRHDTEEQHLRNISQMMAEPCKSLGIWILTALQLNQEGNARGGEGIKLAADAYLTLDRDEAWDGPWTPSWMNLQLCRYGPSRAIGSQNAPSLTLHPHGPHFIDRKDEPAVEQDDLLGTSS